MDTPVRDLRAAVVCLIDRNRAAWRLPALRLQTQLDRAAQAHSAEMVATGSFSHGAEGASSLGARLERAGYRWSQAAEAIATGFATPAQAVDAWMASTVHCQILLSPVYRAVGVGVVRRPVPGTTTLPGTWTGDFGLALGNGPPSANWAPAKSCPH